MINISEAFETQNMIQHENLDVRTVTMGISLLDCADSDVDKTCENIRSKIKKLAGNLAKTADEISERMFSQVLSTSLSAQSRRLIPIVTVLTSRFSCWIIF